MPVRCETAEVADVYVRPSSSRIHETSIRVLGMH